MTSGFLTLAAQIRGLQILQFSSLSEVLVFESGLLLVVGDFHYGQSILTPGVVRGLDWHFPERDHVRPGDDADFFTSGGGLEPLAEVSLGVGNRQSFHHDS